MSVNQLPAYINLNGNWDFAYTPTTKVYEKNAPVPPISTEYHTTMPVPGYWDDHLENLKRTQNWNKAFFNPEYRPVVYPTGPRPPDASTPFLIGLGWYRKILTCPLEWEGKLVTLEIGGARLDSWVWLNKCLVHHHSGYSTPFRLSLNLRPNYENELVIAIGNTRNNRMGCAIRGWKGRTGGIYRPVFLKITAQLKVDSLYVYPLKTMEKLRWQLNLTGDFPPGVSSLEWSIRSKQTGKSVKSGTFPVKKTKMLWDTDTDDLAPWSDNSPSLYDLELNLKNGGSILDRHTQSFGFRSIKRKGRNLVLNNRPIYLRGATEHSYYPETCLPPLGIEYYRKIIKKLKDIGFNWLRFHTSVPSPEYMDAADELGMMLQVEPPKGFDEKEWLEILLECRQHPSVIIYCCGNEELLDEAKIKFLQRMAKLTRKYVPDALFNPQEGLRGVEYYWEPRDLGEDQIDDPYPHNPTRLEKLKTFSDCFGHYSWGQLSYGCATVDLNLINQRTRLYERPCLSHEIGIIGTYLDIELEQRYKNTRIGSDIFQMLRRNLKNAGLLDRAGSYYRNSCAWATTIRKRTVETARFCKHLDGYDYLGAIDCHWHRTGYPCGILNEFYETKPGESQADILKYNGDSILILRLPDEKWNLWNGEKVNAEIWLSPYDDALKEGVLNWALLDSKKIPLVSGKSTVVSIKRGVNQLLLRPNIVIPHLDRPETLILKATLSCKSHTLTNDWKFWGFPKNNIPRLSRQSLDSCWICRKRIDTKVVEYLDNGGRCLLLGTGPFPSLPTTFQPAIAGRANGNLATVIEDHVIMNEFPHEGFCDWQFRDMLEDGKAIDFNTLDVKFAPVIEIVSSFKDIHKQGVLCEFRIGKGKLLVCSLNMNMNDPAARFLANQLLDYLKSDRFKPKHVLSHHILLNLLKRQNRSLKKFTTDQAYDQNASFHT